MIRPLIKKFLEKYLIPTRAQEIRYRRRHLLPGTDQYIDKYAGQKDEWVKAYWDSVSHPHRPFLVEKISQHAPFKSILEIGSNCGPNLYLLAKKFPNAIIHGIEINPQAVKVGNENFAKEGINVQLFEGKASRLGHIPDKYYDIVFTDATLLLVGPDKIRHVAREMLRIVRKAILMLEWHNEEDQEGLGIYNKYWERNYKALFSRFIKHSNRSLSLSLSY